MSFSASFNGRPLVNTTRKNACKNACKKACKNAYKVVKSDFPVHTPGYYNVLRTARGSASAFAKAVELVSKGR